MSDTLFSLPKYRYPIGIQTFRDVIEGDYQYVDKTGYVWQLANSYKYVFLSRPRRFGKSLLTSTFESFFNGDRILFEGLDADRYEQHWLRHAVLHFDLSTAKNSSAELIESELLRQLKHYESLYGSDSVEITPGGKLAGIINRAYAKTKRGVVILIDEYDAPILDSIHNKKISETTRRVLQEFYAPIKSCDRFLRFVFITGITKFSQLSIFSSFNNIVNISLEPRYSAVCGITELELSTQLRDGLIDFAQHNNLSTDDAQKLLKSYFNGYRFSKASPEMYNPFSLISAMQNGTISSYWFSSGTPTFITRILKEFDTNLEEIENVDVDVTSFDIPIDTLTDPLPVLYQSGYLTIRDYDWETQLYTLGYPNKEVKIGFMKSLIPIYISSKTTETKSFVSEFYRYIKRDDIDGALALMRDFFSTIPYTLSNKTERDYQTIMYIIFSLLGQYVEVEVCSAAGRADIVLQTDTSIYVLELKLDGSAKKALQQIDNKGYLLRYSRDTRRLVKIGINFSSQLRTLSEWIIECSD